MSLSMRLRRPQPSDPSPSPSPSSSYSKVDKQAKSSGTDDKGFAWFLPLFALGMLRYISATSNIIHDCDEVFNYWEPLRYLLYRSGFQTWEYKAFILIERLLVSFKPWSQPITHNKDHGHHFSTGNSSISSGNTLSSNPSVPSTIMSPGSNINASTTSSSSADSGRSQCVVAPPLLSWRIESQATTHSQTLQI